MTRTASCLYSAVVASTKDNAPRLTTRCRNAWIIIAGLQLALLGRVGFAAPPQRSIADAESHAGSMREGMSLFRAEVRRILQGRCVQCHGGKSTEGEFDLSTREGLLRGGATGPAIVVGQSHDSLLMQLVRHRQEPKMPQNGAALDERQVGLLARWIDLGAPYDQPLIDHAAESVPWTERPLDAGANEFWSLRPLQNPSVPTIDDVWIRTDIDRFLLADMRNQGLVPRPMADRRTLLRRVTFDLWGLPPTAEEVTNFLNDSSPEAWKHVVDRLLDHPRYGTRWARHWLDVARFAESHGFEQDYDRPHAYHYRDFVIEALNQDLPYDQFVQWQIAGDEIAPEQPLAWKATGFLGAGVFPTQLTEREFERARYDELDDMVSTIGTAMLGLTIGCARCHDHKFDPITSGDYYRFVATFATTIRSHRELDLDPVGNQQRQAAFESQRAPHAAALAEHEQTLAVAREQWIAQRDKGATWEPLPVEADRPLMEEVRVLLDAQTPHSAWNDAQRQTFDRWFFGRDARWNELQGTLAKIDQQRPARHVTTAMVCSEGLPPLPHHADDRGFPHFYPQVHFLRRGDVDQKEGIAEPRFLRAIGDRPDWTSWSTTAPSQSSTSMRRRALAQWLTDPNHGAGQLVARVSVNRVWHHHFGRGIVATPNDFGFQGARPTHPELLDWLASQFIESGWSLKQLHRQILLSAAYQQASTLDPTCRDIDPENQFFWHYSPRRLEAEALRDSLLYVAGRLDETPYGPGTLDEAMRRRSIYFMIKRSQLIPSLQIFDVPEPLVSVGSRPQTAIAPQALYFMNHPQVRENANSLAQQLLSTNDPGDSAVIVAAYQRLLSRPPTDSEIADALDFLGAQRSTYHEHTIEKANALAWTDWLQVMFCLNEFAYLP